MRYQAFLSYSRVDNRAAGWLHGQLDRYRTPKSLVEAKASEGTIPKALHPIFRDRTDLPGGGELAAQIKTALKESSTLVVLCSPAAAQSIWVNREIETFLELGRDHKIFPVIAPDCADTQDVEGDFFPPALRGRGLLAVDLREIKLANGRIVGDGRESGRFKLIAGLLGVKLDDLLRRERLRQRQRLYAVSAAATVFLAIGVAAIWASIVALQNMNLAETRRVAQEAAMEKAVAGAGPTLLSAAEAKFQANEISDGLELLLANAELRNSDMEARLALASRLRVLPRPALILRSDDGGMSVALNDSGSKLAVAERRTSPEQVASWALWDVGARARQRAFGEGDGAPHLSPDGAELFLSRGTQFSLLRKGSPPVVVEEECSIPEWLQGDYVGFNPGLPTENISVDWAKRRVHFVDWCYITFATKRAEVRSYSLPELGRVKTHELGEAAVAGAFLPGPIALDAGLLYVPKATGSHVVSIEDGSVDFTIAADPPDIVALNATWRPSEIKEAVSGMPVKDGLFLSGKSGALRYARNGESIEQVSPVYGRLLSVSSDGVRRAFSASTFSAVFDFVQSRKEVRLPAPAALIDVASGANRIAVLTNRGDLLLVDDDTLRIVASIPKSRDQVVDLMFNATGSELAVLGQNDILIIRSSDGQVVSTHSRFKGLDLQELGVEPIYAEGSDRPTWRYTRDGQHRYNRDREMSNELFLGFVCGNAGELYLRADADTIYDLYIRFNGMSDWDARCASANSARSVAESSDDFVFADWKDLRLNNSTDQGLELRLGSVAALLWSGPQLGVRQTFAIAHDLSAGGAQPLAGAMAADQSYAVVAYTSGTLRVDDLTIYKTPIADLRARACDLVAATDQSSDPARWEPRMPDFARDLLTAAGLSVGEPCVGRQEWATGSTIRQIRAN